MARRHAEYLFGVAANRDHARERLGGGALATIAGIRSTMFVGVVPIAAVTVVVARRHRSSAPR
jgi:hypothetical protein